MARCIYCGRPAGFMHKMHAECKERHERAMSLIPSFFPKFFETALPVNRFRVLLQKAAEASFIKPDELKKLTIVGISKMIDSLLEQRLPTKDDTQRIRRIINVFCSIFSDDITPRETFAKIDILQGLQDAKIPELINVTGPMPIEFSRGETVIWIFNGVTSYRQRRTAEMQNARSGVSLTLDTVAYYGLAAFKNAPVPRDDLGEESNCDIVVTNRTFIWLPAIRNR